MKSSGIKRTIKSYFLEHLKPGKVSVIHGARRTGKTAFIQDILADYHGKYSLYNGEDMEVQNILSVRSTEKYRALVGDIDLLVIDEAQHIPDIGMALKMLVDNFSHLKIIATGSSVFDLSNKLGEPLVGRQWTYQLFPFAQMEYSTQENIIQTKQRLEERLILGCYPELMHIPAREEKIRYLKELTQAYLLKDILEYDNIRNSNKLFDLLRLLAFQVGSEVSLSELGNQLGLHKDTVFRYLDLLSKVFVIYRQGGFSRNLRKEVSKMDRWYFYDNGILNAITNNFNPLISRNDQGVLWENYIMAERMKYLSYKRERHLTYYWRTYQQQEIDLIEEWDGQLLATEIKWSPKKSKLKAPSAFAKAYPDATYQCIHPDNYMEFIM